MSVTQRQLLIKRLAKARVLGASAEEANDCVAKRTVPPLANALLIPLSHAQERMWFLHQLDPQASAYNVCVLWHLRGQLNTNILKRSAIRITSRHSVFRTLYSADEEGNAYQKCLSTLPPEWTYEDLQELDAEQQGLQLEAIAQQASTERFDLSVNTSLRLVLTALSERHHVLVMVGQHIAWDGPSFGIFANELAYGYNLLLGEQVQHQASSPAQYIEFADWHRRQWSTPSPRRDATLKFWETQLTPAPEPLDFPIDLDRRATDSESGSWSTELLDKDTTASFLQLCRGEKVTPFELLITTIAVLMTRLSRSKEITIGTVASHRNLPELNDVIGNFGNVVPLRLKIPSNWCFRQALQHCANVCRSAFSHADLPFEHLLDHLNIARGESSNPLLDTMVTFLSHGMGAPSMKGLDVEWCKHFNGTTQADLSFDALLQNGRLQLQATWRTSLYRAETIPNHLKRLSKLLRVLTANPDSIIAEQTLLLPGEYEQLIDEWGSRPAIPKKAPTLVDWFEKTVCEKPKAIALLQTQTDDNRNTTFDAQKGLDFISLNIRANKLARWLIAQGVGPENSVAICLPRRFEWFVAMLATLKSGAAFLPIDTNHPSDYVNRVIRLATPSLIFIDELASPEIVNQAEKREEFINLSTIENDAITKRFSGEDVSNSERTEPLMPIHPACIVFTSGSSGEPKGVVVQHTSLTNLLSSHREDLYQEASKQTGKKVFRVGHAWSLAFDASWQPTLWMFEGHELHLFDTDTMRDPIALAREIIQRRLDFIELTPGMLGEVLPWLEQGLTEPDGRYLPGHVPAILGFGGESVKENLWQRILRLQQSTGFNLYGPTETTVDTMIARATPGKQANIGRPIAGARAYIIDTCMQLAPPGVPGELAISGLGLARGYLNRGDITASRFVANPYGQAGSRLYLTGDRVRWLPNGDAEYIGRIDEQIKIRGFRVEPMEVEASVEKLIQQPCAVTTRHQPSGPQLLCFYESEKKGTSSTRNPEILRQLCMESLPSHLVPKYFISVQRLPKLPNGKINRRALPMPKHIDSAKGRPPKAPIEHKLCALFSEVLGCSQISIEEGFFELGGDSISVIKLVSLARREGLFLTARQIFDLRNVARLAEHLKNQNTASDADVNRSSSHDEHDVGQAPITTIMEKHLASNVPLKGFAQLVRMPIPNTLSEAEIIELLNALIQRHALLRAQIKQHPGGENYLDIPKNSAKFSTTGSKVKPYIRSYELLANQPQANANMGCTSKENSAQIQITSTALAKELCDQLDPSKGVMVSAAIVKNSQSNQNTLWLAINHFVIDASSWHILAGDLAIARNIQKRNEPIYLPPVPTAWRSWSKALERPHPKRSKQSRLQGTLASASEMTWTLAPSSEGKCPVKVAAEKLGVTFTSLLPVLLALAATRAELVPQKQLGQVCVVIERHGREPSAPGQDLSRTIGWFANEVAVKVDGLDIDKNTLSKHSSTLRRWCWSIAQTEFESEKTSEDISLVEQPENWQLGFNFLGDLAMTKESEWIPQPCLNLLADACGEYWPLLHNLNINAYYENQDGTPRLRIHALGPKPQVTRNELNALFVVFKDILDELIKKDHSSIQQSSLFNKPVKVLNSTPLQYEILQQSEGEYDPWMTQMELQLASTEKYKLSESSLKHSASRLLNRHEALRAGFTLGSNETFIPETLDLDWQYQDLSDFTTQNQHALLTEIRQDWSLHKFNLGQPPLIRFMLFRLSKSRWLLFIKCHHLLLDGWSLPRLLHELLGNAVSGSSEKPIHLCWSHYLEWLEKQDQGKSWSFWNSELHDVNAPSLVCPKRDQRTPSKELSKSIKKSKNEAITEAAKIIDVSLATVYQMAWAKTLSKILQQNDVVFGLFDSGRSAYIDGIDSLVGLPLQLIPIRIDTNSSDAISVTLKKLQSRNFEWQALAPIRLDRLEVSNRYGEFFDTLLVIENALKADTETTKQAANKLAVESPLSVLEKQSWQDSIGQSMGLFIYPENELKLRLCYDSASISSDFANGVLTSFEENLCDLANEINRVNTLWGSAQVIDISTNPTEILSTETTHE